MTRRNPEDIHNYAGKLRRTRRRLASVNQGDTAVRFLDRLKLAGRKDGRIAYYGDRLPLILDLFNTMSDAGPVTLEEATKADCESVMYRIISCESYGGETKKAYAMTLLRLVHYAKTGELGDRDGNPYVPEVAWIRPSRYLDRNHEPVRSQDLLTSDEVISILGQVSDVCDRAMFWAMFEGSSHGASDYKNLTVLPDGAFHLDSRAMITYDKADLPEDSYSAAAYSQHPSQESHGHREGLMDSKFMWEAEVRIDKGTPVPVGKLGITIRNVPEDMRGRLREKYGVLGDVRFVDCGECDLEEL